ncbi:MAG: hypothetical protein M3Q08_16960 [Pseudomonadota bacterium]|nr:hypothetical protein [Pseudomonadota bacterium]
MRQFVRVANVVVELLQQQAMKIDEVARQSELKRLPGSTLEIFVAVNEAIEQQTTGIHFCLGLDDCAAPVEGYDFGHRRPEGLLLLLADRVVAPELDEELFYHWTLLTGRVAGDARKPKHTPKGLFRSTPRLHGKRRKALRVAYAG